MFWIIGGGKMGISHLALITPYLGKSMVVLVEPKRSVRLLLSYFGYRSFSNVQKALRKAGKPKGVIIATPTASHAALIEWAISNNIPFFVEKPLTLDAERSQILCKSAAEKGVPAQVGFVMRYVPSFQKVRSLIADGQLGAVKSYRASMSGNVISKPPKRSSWQGDFVRGGGCLNEYGPHIIDLTRFIFGEIDSVSKAAKGHVHCVDADDWIELEWHHLSGVAGALEIDWCDATKRKSTIQFEIIFDSATVRVDNSALEIISPNGADLNMASRCELDQPSRPPNVGYYLRGEEFSLELEDFLGTCLGTSVHVDSNLPRDVTPKLEDGYAVDRLIDEIARKAGLK
ncbi:Gfo/Idh/MocA family oxidoreductase [Sulfitobacter sp. JBTF-M27]|uniref:Gfo/Idh/MocA family oxidoreductase n=1 Tax=Sulfitobacter sediminilitoris TaxID=2698830 RepID=A0A6P0CG68_9RHOB|nr:Gfo/Idh/MocA family oxidoreductase [Sulfitobacter sediminilitoris]NEK25142.1 Gfo/Idh/MocA family oxidoreductase [Sulfitobacter sediminilitoris]